MIIDFHTHTGRRDMPCSLADIRRGMKRNEIDASVVFPSTQLPPATVLSMSLANANNLVGCRDILPFLRFDPKSMHHRRLADMSKGFAGFKLHPRGEDFNPLDRRFTSIFKAMESTGKPIIVHTRKEYHKGSDPDKLIELAKHYKLAKFVFAHFAMDSDPFFDEVGALENAFVDTSIVSSPRIIEMRVDQVGADKIVFGSDFPFSDQEIELLKVRGCAIAESKKRLILADNAIRLLKPGGNESII